MNVVQYVECPYCGTSKLVRMHIESTDYTVREVVTCDCDRFYVVGFCLIVEVTTLKIEGEQAKYDAFEEACAADLSEALSPDTTTPQVVSPTMRTGN